MVAGQPTWNTLTPSHGSYSGSSSRRGQWHYLSGLKLSSSPTPWLATSPSPGQERACYPIFVSHSELKWGRVLDHSNALMFAMYCHPHWQERGHSIQDSHRTRSSKQWPTDQTLPAACFGKYVVLMEDSHAHSLTHWPMEDFTLRPHSWEAVSDNIRLTKPKKMFTTWPFKKCDPALEELGSAHSRVKG